MLFDTHAHYDAEQFDQDRETVLAGLPARDVSLVVNPGCDVPTSRTAAELVPDFDWEKVPREAIRLPEGLFSP